MGRARCPQRAAQTRAEQPSLALRPRRAGDSAPYPGGGGSTVSIQNRQTSAANDSS